MKLIITESQYALLLEASRLDVLRGKYNQLSPEEFDKIVGADPSKTNSYSQWLLELNRKGKLPIESDFASIANHLSIFDKVKVKLAQKDINQYKSIQELADAVKDHTATEAQMTKRERIETLETNHVYENAEWIVVSPKTFQASRYWGTGTKWCTAATDGAEQFNNYTSRSPLYIFINKLNRKEKYQFHNRSEQFKDVEDKELFFRTWLFGSKEPAFGDKLTLLARKKPLLADAMKQTLDAYSSLKLNLPISDRQKIYYGDLSLHDEKQIGRLPDGFRVTGDLNLFSREPLKLPNNLRVDGGMSVRSSNISSLPKGLYVGKNLDISFTKIKKLPDDVFVGGDLFMYAMSVDEIMVPDTVQVKGETHVDNAVVRSQTAQGPQGFSYRKG